jgi:integrase
MVDAPFAVDLSGRFPGFRIEAKAQKGKRSEKVPMTPDFAEWLLQTPEEDREGPVFPMPNLVDGRSLGVWRVGKTVSAIGEKAGVVVNKEDQKFASAHDLRRSFGTRWAMRVKPAVLQKLMRNTRITTTMRYYVSLEADDVAAELWARHSENGNTLGNPSTENSERHRENGG